MDFDNSCIPYGRLTISLQETLNIRHFQVYRCAMTQRILDCLQETELNLAFGENKTLAEVAYEQMMRPVIDEKFGKAMCIASDCRENGSVSFTCAVPVQ